MNDEFEVNIEDGSAGEVAERILKERRRCCGGDFGGVEEMLKAWREKGGAELVASAVEEEGDEDNEDNEFEDAGEDGDVEMEEAPRLVKAPKEKAVPMVDEDGFTKVVGKKKR